VGLLKLLKLSKLSDEEKNRILQRASIDISHVRVKVEEIIERVRRYGDREIITFYEEFYGRSILSEDSIRVSSDEFEEAYEHVSEKLIKALEYAIRNISLFHKRQLPPELWLFEVDNGVFVGQVWKPLDSVGVYVPGGRAAYPSTALMTTIPAKIAGVPEIIVCTPPRADGKVHPVTLVALDMVGVRRVYKVGGAHAIAAMAYGTKSIPKVEKIVGPGNIWVTVAKQLLQGVVSIDFTAGPSEILIIADESANPRYIASDLVAQVEHDPYSTAILVTTSEKLAKQVVELVSGIAMKSPRRNIIIEALKRYSAVILVDSIDEAFKFANEYAPEHLEVVVRDLTLTEILKKVRNAGSIFIGPYTPVALGDYVIGTNHVLPTTMNAKKRGGLSVYDFIKIIDFQYVTVEGYKRLYKYATVIAEVEGLIEHKNSLEVRVK